MTSGWGNKNNAHCTLSDDRHDFHSSHVEGPTSNKSYFIQNRSSSVRGGEYWGGYPMYMYIKNLKSWGWALE